MNFATPSFLFYFFPTVVLVYFLFPKLKNITLVLFSGLFYFWAEGNFLFLLYLWILINYFASKAIYKYEHKQYLILAIFFNVAVLVYFKYLTFILSNLTFLGISLHDLRIYLPLAVSFLTFHAISYQVDVFKKVIKPEHNFVRLTLYFTFFPHLIAGPIIRLHQISSQLYKRPIDLEMISRGIYRFVGGLFKKLVIANTLALVADEVFAIGPQHLNPAQAWLGIISFSLQIYYDFSGYTDMAIGLGMIFGFRFPENFNYPYMTSSIGEFWRRWHITLSNWIRDYIYIPLGGNRKGEVRTYLNLAVAFSITGLWHGANWTFLVWGAIHAFFIILERIKGGILFNWMFGFYKHLYALFVLLISWVFFRSVDLTQSIEFIKLMFGISSSNQTVYYKIGYFLDKDIVVTIIIAIIFATTLPKNIITRLNLEGRSLIAYRLASLVVLIGGLIFSLIYLAGPTFQSFIYFRF